MPGDAPDPLPAPSREPATQPAPRLPPGRAGTPHPATTSATTPPGPTRTPHPAAPARGRTPDSTPAPSPAPAAQTPLPAPGRLLVVGNINRDIKIAPIDPSPNLFDDGETSTAAVRETIGGGGANSALAAASLGSPLVTFLGKVGADALGDRLARTLAARGVRAALARDPRHPTGSSVNLVYTTGHRHFVSCLPSSATLSFDDLDLSTLAAHDHLLRADPWFSDPMLLGGGNRKLFQAARAAGVPVSLDVNWDPHWTAAPDDVVAARKQALRDVLPLVDLAHGNVRELCTFTDAPDGDLTEALRRLAAWGVAAVVVHLGPAGSGFYAAAPAGTAAATLTTRPAVPAERVVNTTGTGDVLSVCMMLLHRNPQMDPAAKLHLANTLVSDYISGRRDLVPELV
jgi:2-dehydro-3-deoxygluconokinase